ncbi:uncharacterized protein LOC120292029 [Eucalyptus grandis]|uniref:uncharacterized protein LOC120292029 n=1 Tax=Eucalyptus grandis TaxID=71139 RepID=UPI00192E7BCE|nr:uncharacterized protein LOC120292029 [Eucalyptus grandis]
MYAVAKWAVAFSVHLDVDSKGTTSGEASQGGHGPTEVKPKPEVNVRYRPLFEAAVKGDWKGAEEILDHDPEAITATILTSGTRQATVSDIAVTAGQDQFMENLVKRVPAKNKAPILEGALYHAARTGKIRRVKELVDDLDKVGKSGVEVALSIATGKAPKQKEVIWYLAKHMKSKPENDLVLALIKAGHLDILLDLANKHPNLRKFDESENHGLSKDLVQVKSYYRSGARLNFWEKFIYQCIPSSVDPSSHKVKDTKMARGIFVNLLMDGLIRQKAYHSKILLIKS